MNFTQQQPKQQKANQSSSSTTIGTHDVLLGRGGQTNGHVGNVKFRAIVAVFALTYLDTKKVDKLQIVKRIIDLVHENGGRFLQKSSNSDVWAEAPEERAITKTGQALREKLDVRNGYLRLKSNSTTKQTSKRSEQKVFQMQGYVLPSTTGVKEVPSTPATTKTTFTAPNNETNGLPNPISPVTASEYSDSNDEDSIAPEVPWSMSVPVVPPLFDEIPELIEDSFADIFEFRQLPAFVEDQHPQHGLQR